MKRTGVGKARDRKKRGGLQAIPEATRIVALLSDFGSRDAYVGVMKAVMLQIDPTLRLVDLSHDIEPFAVCSAAYVLYSAWDHFSAGTVFLAVVDPGVGSERAVLLATDGLKFLVCADNGTVSLLLRMRQSLRTYSPKDVLPYRSDSGAVPVAPTFHGRDIFAPLAARTAVRGFDSIRGRDLTPVLLEGVHSEIDSDNELVRGRIMHVDRFGNCITSVHEGDLGQLSAPDGRVSRTEVRAGGFRVAGVRQYYAQVAPKEPLAYFGSSGFLELALRNAHASSEYGLRTGDSVLVHKSKNDSRNWAAPSS